MGIQLKSQILLKNEEIEIVKKLSQGCYLKEIGSDLGYSQQTIIRKVDTICNKLSVQTKIHAVLMCVKLGYLNINDLLNLKHMEFVYATAHDLCDKCSKKYINHPLDMTILGYDDLPFLHVGCDGQRLKL